MCDGFNSECDRDGPFSELKASLSHIPVTETEERTKIFSEFANRPAAQFASISSACECDSSEIGGSCESIRQARFSSTLQGCKHYRRGCLVKCATCSKYYPCHLCHDEDVSSHMMERAATKKVACKRCHTSEQDVASNCRNCGVLFAKYFCRACVLYENDETRDIYHCPQCGICRVGKGIGIDQFHCDRCDSCVPIEVKDTHLCLPNALQGDCPICLLSVRHSTRRVVLMRCGHATHEDCFSKLTETSYRCPLCYKSLTDMGSWFRSIEKALSQEFPLPEPFNRRVSQVHCFDCEKGSTAPFHFTFHACSHCKGYNTRVVSVADMEHTPGMEN